MWIDLVSAGLEEVVFGLLAAKRKDLETVRESPPDGHDRQWTVFSRRARSGEELAGSTEERQDVFEVIGYLMIHGSAFPSMQPKFKYRYHYNPLPKQCLSA